MQPHDANNSEAEHQWVLAQWTTGKVYGIGVWICSCGAARRVVYNPDKLEVIDPDSLQEDGAATWSGV